MNTIKVKTDKRIIEVAKLPIGKYAQLLSSVQELPKHLSTFEKLDQSAIMEQLPTLIGTSLPDLIRIITIATDASEEEINEWGLEEFTNIVLAILEANKYKNVFDSIKKAFTPQKQEI